MDWERNQHLTAFAVVAYGVVVEVGLGPGRLHRALRENHRVLKHIVVESDAECVAKATDAGWLRPDCRVIVGTIPAVHVPESNVDVVFLDLDNARDPARLAWAANLLKSQGIIVTGS